MDRIKLFCFPYAGGGAAIFNGWKKDIDPGIELVPVELAGRGRRIGEAHYKDLAQAVADILVSIKKEISYCSYALFGHSMGGLLCYELAQQIRSYRFPPPRHIFFSGKGAPHIDRKDQKKYHLMDMDEFRKELIDMGGTPPEFFESPEMMRLFLPVLKNDFRIVETVVPDMEIRPLDVDISVLLGRKDDLTAEECEEWSRHTTRDCNFHYFEGGHFFFNEETPRIVNIINRTCKRAILSKL